MEASHSKKEPKELEEAQFPSPCWSSPDEEILSIWFHKFLPNPSEVDKDENRRLKLFLPPSSRTKKESGEEKRRQTSLQPPLLESLLDRSCDFRDFAYFRSIFSSRIPVFPESFSRSFLLSGVQEQVTECLSRQPGPI